MSNSLGTITPTLVAQRALEVLAQTYPAITAIVNDFSDQGVLYNQTITSRIPSVGAVADYDADNGYVAGTGTLTDVSVVLNKHKHATVAFNENELSATNLNLVEQYAASLAEGIGAQVMSDIGALFVSGNYSDSFTVAQNAWTRKTVIVKGNTELNKNLAPKNGRFLIGSSDAIGQLWQDDSLVQADFGGQGIQAGNIPSAHGVAIHEYSGLITSGNLLGVVAQKNAVVFASRVPSDAGAGDLPLNGRISNVRDPKTGLTIQVREHYDMQKGKRFVTYAIQYGVAKGSADCLLRIVSA